MRRYSIIITSKRNPRGLELVIVDAPQWTRRMVSLGYLLMRLTGDRHGLGLVSRGYRLHDELRSQFRIPMTGEQIDEFRSWSRTRKRRRWPRQRRRT